mmetsp:Transcript_694/g.2216  ORF Transcript_694/g.2216 Transcript_694/m.2216 type:complete len:274 (+) Transcript_694:615-1436(+)
MHATIMRGNASGSLIASRTGSTMPIPSKATTACAAKSSVPGPNLAVHATSPTCSKWLCTRSVPMSARMTATVHHSTRFATSIGQPRRCMSLTQQYGTRTGSWTSVRKVTEGGSGRSDSRTARVLVAMKIGYETQNRNCEATRHESTMMSPAAPAACRPISAKAPLLTLLSLWPRRTASWHSSSWNMPAAERTPTTANITDAKSTPTCLYMLGTKRSIGPIIALSKVSMAVVFPIWPDASLSTDAVDPTDALFPPKKEPSECWLIIPAPPVALR